MPIVSLLITSETAHSLCNFGLNFNINSSLCRAKMRLIWAIAFAVVCPLLRIFESFCMHVYVFFALGITCVLLLQPTHHMSTFLSGNANYKPVIDASQGLLFSVSENTSVGEVLSPGTLVSSKPFLWSQHLPPPPPPPPPPSAPGGVEGEGVWECCDHKNVPGGSHWYYWCWFSPHSEGHISHALYLGLAHCKNSLIVPRMVISDNMRLVYVCVKLESFVFLKCFWRLFCLGFITNRFCLLTTLFAFFLSRFGNRCY